MAGLNLNLLTENASRLGARLQETLSEHTRDLNISRSGASYFDGPEDKVKNIGSQLDSNSDREKLDALKRLIALLSKGRNVSEFFPKVVKNVASTNLEIRKLVYIYLLRHAESEPDLALLSINTFQKDLTDPNPLIRAMALRVLSGMNVPMIGSIVIMAIKKCAADVSPYVRKAAAFALVKCYRMDTSHLPELIPILETLLKDRSALSVGSVAIAFQSICPTRLDLLHKHYRRLCRILVDADEWGQINLLDLLSRYARTMLMRPIPSEDGRSMQEIDPDLKLLLNSAEPLFMSRNPAVVITVCRLFYYLSGPAELSKIVPPMLRLMSSSSELERIILAYLVPIVHEHPHVFSQHYTRFLIRASDMSAVKRDKMRILEKLILPENYSVMLREFTDYAADDDTSLVTQSIFAIGRCARVVPESGSQCMSSLLNFIKSRSDVVVSSAVLVLKSLVLSGFQTSKGSVSAPAVNFGVQSPLKIIADLAAKLDDIKHASARACILWLVGQYAADPSQRTGVPGVAKWAPDVLRKVAKTFPSEAPVTKLQALVLAAKLQVLSPEHQTLTLLLRYIFAMAQYDLNYDVRDRARMLSTLLSGAIQKPGLDGLDEDASVARERAGVVLRLAQVKLVLFEGKTSSQEDEFAPGDHDQTVLGSLETVLGKPMGLDASRRFPDWPEAGTDSALRDSADDSAPSSSSAMPMPTAIAGMAGRGGLALPPQSMGMGMGSQSPPVILTPTGPSAMDAAQEKRGPWQDLDRFYESESAEEGEGEVEEDDDEETSEEEGDDEEEGNASDPPAVQAANAIQVQQENNDAESSEEGTSETDGDEEKVHE